MRLNPFSYFTKKPPSTTDGKLRSQLGLFNHHFGSYIKVMIVNRMLNSVMILTTFILIMSNYLGDAFEVEEPDHIATIAFTGVVSSQNQTGNARNFAEHFEHAVKEEHAKAILVIASSGGGSPVQAEMINSKIRDYIESAPIDERKPVYVSVQEVCASACIMAFSGADKIFVHENSLIGSISVRMDGWAIDKALARFDIERKVLTPGKYKDLFDPYKNLTASEKDIIMSNLLEPMHQLFVDSVRANRGDRLNETDMLFTGMAFHGVEGVQLGLADEVRSTLSIEDELKAQFSVDNVKRYNRPGFSFKNLLTSSLEDAIRGVVAEQSELRVSASL